MSAARTVFHDGASGAALAALPSAQPCPFCGATHVEMFTHEPAPDRGDSGSAFAQCSACMAQGPSAAHAHEAAQAWNTRRQPREAEAKGAKMRKGRPLPAPFGDVYVHVRADDVSCVVEFVGRPHELIAAGCASLAMTERNGKWSRRVDEHGRHYARDVRPHGRVMVRRYLPRDLAAKLPGVAPWLAEIDAAAARVPLHDAPVSAELRPHGVTLQ